MYLLAMLASKNVEMVGMHNTRFLVNIQYADILKLIWPIPIPIFFSYIYLVKLYGFLYCGVKILQLFVILIWYQMLKRKLKMM